MTRLELLQQFVQDDPGDPFNHYALALELMKHDSGKAAELFEKLLSDYENYLPTYYQAANLFESTGKHELAISVLKKGIALAKTSREIKTQNELQTMLDEFDD